jgi:hypothetical protein
MSGQIIDGDRITIKEKALLTAKENYKKNNNNNNSDIQRATKTSPVS